MYTTNIPRPLFKYGKITYNGYGQYILEALLQIRYFERRLSKIPKKRYFVFPFEPSVFIMKTVNSFKDYQICSVFFF